MRDRTPGNYAARGVALAERLRTVGGAGWAGEVARIAAELETLTAEHHMTQRLLNRARDRIRSVAGWLREVAPQMEDTDAGRDVPESMARELDAVADDLEASDARETRNPPSQRKRSGK